MWQNQTNLHLFTRRSKNDVSLFVKDHPITSTSRIVHIYCNVNDIAQRKLTELISYHSSHYIIDWNEALSTLDYEPQRLSSRHNCSIEEVLANYGLPSD